MKKGFTLVELLAVIVILAVIALITTPILLNVIESSRKSTALNSAEGYVRAVSNYLIMNEVSDGLYSVLDNNIKAEYTGTGPSNGSITIKKGNVESANLCINKYSIDYVDGVSSISENDYCKDTNNKTLIIKKNNEQVKKVYIGASTSTSIEKEEGTNVVCNNGVTIKEEDGKIKVENILGNSECNFNNNLEDAINKIDNTKNNVLLLSDINLENTLTINEGKDVVLDLNGKNVTGTNLITNKGVLTINDSLKTGSLIATGTGITNSSNGVLNLNNINIESNGRTIVNNDSATMNIDGGKYISTTTIVIFNTSNKNINIKDENGSIYIYTTGSSGLNSESGINGVKSIHNASSGNVYIKGHIADKCTDTEENTRGICIYNGYGRTVLNEDTSTGNIYIDGATIISKESFAVNNFIGKIYICNAQLNGKKGDIRNVEVGYIYYTDSVILETGIKSDIKNDPSHIILNNDITCE